jgi:hypothetical protein
MIMSSSILNDSFIISFTFVSSVSSTLIPVNPLHQHRSVYLAKNIYNMFWKFFIMVDWNAYKGNLCWIGIVNMNF